MASSRRALYMVCLIAMISRSLAWIRGVRCGSGAWGKEGGREGGRVRKEGWKEGEREGGRVRKEGEREGGRREERVRKEGWKKSKGEGRE